MPGIIGGGIYPCEGGGIYPCGGGGMYPCGGGAIFLGGGAGGNAVGPFHPFTFGGQGAVGGGIIQGLGIGADTV